MIPPELDKDYLEEYLKTVEEPKEKKRSNKRRKVGIEDIEDISSIGRKEKGINKEEKEIKEEWENFWAQRRRMWLRVCFLRKNGKK